jgi:23S rRNA (adenine2030-N6)-methyltransferase
MYSYRHAFHAGNHADVLKHAVLVALLKYLGQKDKAFWVIDTHAGAGAYEFHSGEATKNAEHEGGVVRLLDEKGLPPLLADYLAAVRAFNTGKRITQYPGSPFLADRLTRPIDRLRFFEMHSTDHRLLSHRFPEAEKGDKRAIVKREDGFAGLKSLLPPPAASRRALVIIDPSYEDKREYARVRDAVADSLGRFAQGIYAVWYPILQLGQARQLPERLRSLGAGRDWLDVSLTVRSPSKDGYGMHGSGMFIMNPPYTLPGLLEAAMPVLVARLGLDAGAGYQLAYEIR